MNATIPNQQAKQMDVSYFHYGSQAHVGAGEEGLKDIRVVEAIISRLGKSRSEDRLTAYGRHHSTDSVQP